MQALIDNIAAVVVGAVILFAIAALALRSQSGAVNATQVNMAKTDLRVLIDALEQDLTNAGSGMANPNADAANRVVQSYAESGGVTTLSFEVLPDNEAGTTTPVAVTYTWEQDGTVPLPDGSTTPTFKVQRTVGSVTSTFGTATGFSLTLRDDDLVAVPLGASGTDLALVRYIDVGARLVSPSDVDGLLEQSQWTKRYRPINMDAGRRRIAAAKPPGL